ncbi:ribosomal protein S18-alanine N-acetyltransferase [Serratia fonticola]|uniref:ribosomal protein S18-alanine N-acetyltransferase n=1 Tax=Serratia fonticola TaxID=47917 RepID=UPI0015C5EEBF|nr:ribosomal protein S18-alanine N-acetyltransferase [Serratia fonticola]MBC3378935.1 ribosomal protein S18-alanine N-acetyltransferase [Serratia fonticola]NYA38135.1 ribosomal protein S18-alanine N-acetyltransferase [Serratia fonticola]
MNSISTLTAADLATAFKIEQASHAFPWTEATLATNQGERYLNLKLEAEGQMAGFAITQIVLDEATLFNIAIHPSWQRRGFGRTLLTAMIEQLEARGVVTLWLEVRASNRGAIALYEDLGFNEVTVRRNYYPAASGREDAIVMALPLG